MAKSLYENGTIKVGGSDEWYTPKCAVEVIEKYIPANSRILCPFDTEESQFVKVLSKNHNVIFSHISNGENFFKMGKPDVDYVISNPPYSTKDEIFRQLYNWDIPFALLVNANNTFDSFMRFKLAKEKGVQILFLYPRVKYICGNGGGKISPPFASCYYGYKFFEKDILFDYMNADDVNENQMSIFDII